MARVDHVVVDPHAAIKRDRRITKELSDVRMEPQAAFSDMLLGIGPVQEDLLLSWTATIRGPLETAYEHGEYHLNIRFPPDYPFRPPQFKFRTPILHPNISWDGYVCMDLLNGQWSPALTAHKILVHICLLLHEPNFDETIALQPGLASLHKRDAEHYDAIIRQHTRRHAIPDAPVYECSLFERAALALDSLKYVPDVLYDRINDARLLDARRPLPIKRWRSIKRWRCPDPPPRAAEPGPAEGGDGAGGGRPNAGPNEPAAADAEDAPGGPTLRAGARLRRRRA